MPAARQPLEVRVAQVLDHRAEARVGAEEVLADVRARLGRVLLEGAVHGVVHLAHEHPVDVRREQRIPLSTPDDLDHVPARAAELHLQLLDDLAAATHGAVEPLQVAVDDEDQVVELLPRRDREARLRLRLVHLAVADERPDLGSAGVGEVVVQQIPVDAGLGHGVDRTEAHGHRGKLPEGGHPARVRIRAQPSTIGLTPERVEILLAEPALEERTGVDARRSVTLDEDLIAEAAVVLAVEEVVEPDLVERGGRGVGRQMAAEAFVAMVRAVDHRDGVPPDVGPDPSFQHLVAREPRLVLGRDGVDVRRGDRRRQPDVTGRRVVEQPGQQVSGPRRALGVDDGIEGLDPLTRLVRIGVGQLGDVTVCRHDVLSAGGSPQIRTARRPGSAP